MPKLTVRTVLGSKEFEYRLAEDGPNICPKCSRSTDCSPCPKCENNTYCTFCHECTIGCKPKPSGPVMARVSASCQICKRVFVLDGPEENFKRWAAGGYIQDELAHLSKEERELLISRMCEDCWAKTFSNCE